MLKSNKVLSFKKKKNKESKKIIYLDSASGPKDNPSSIHSLGVFAKERLNLARKKVATFLNVNKDEIIFTSGGTESNNLAIQGIVFGFLEKNKNKIPHLITTNIEHSSVLETVRLLEKRNLADVTILNVEKTGEISPKKIINSIKNNTILISVMSANNEIGTIQPIYEISKELRHFKKINKRENIFFHTDAVQALNYLDLNIQKLGVDLLSLSGLKTENTPRVGVLFKKKNIPLSPIFGGGDQEMSLRPGTENVLEIEKFSKKLELISKIKTLEKERLEKLRNYFIKKIFSSKILSGFKITLNGNLEKRLPNNVNITIKNIPSDLLVLEFSARGIMVSAKSACKAGDGKSSHVISAINPNNSEIDGSLRFSFNKDTSKEDLDWTIKEFEKILTKLKKWYN